MLYIVSETLPCIQVSKACLAGRGFVPGFGSSLPLRIIKGSKTAWVVRDNMDIPFQALNSFEAPEALLHDPHSPLLLDMVPMRVILYYHLFNKLCYYLRALFTATFESTFRGFEAGTPLKRRQGYSRVQVK